MSKAEYIDINGVARKIKGKYIGIGGVARKIKKEYIGVGGVARQCFQGGTPISTLSVGQEVQIKENGVPASYIVVQQGRPNYTYSDGLGYDASCDGTWLLRKQLLAPMEFHSENQTAEYKTSLVHAYLNGEFLTYFSPTIQNGIKLVKIPHERNGHDTTILANENGLATRAFALSMTEVGLHGPAGEGMLLQYFTYADDFEAREPRIARDSNGTARGYFTRTPDRNRVYHVQSNGGDSFSYVTSAFWIRPCIILPSNFAIEELLL